MIFITKLWKELYTELHISVDVFKYSFWLAWMLPGSTAETDEGVRLWCWTGLRLLDFVLLPGVDRSLSFPSVPGGVIFFSLRLFSSSLLERSFLPDDRLLQLSGSLCFPAAQRHIIISYL